MYWECHPILPIINADIIRKSMKNTYLTQDEKNRNQIGENFIVVKENDDI